MAETTMVEESVQDDRIPSILSQAGNTNQIGISEETYLMKTHEARYSRSRLSLITVWWTESVSLLIAIGAFLAIVTIMAVYDNREQPAWKYSLNLNTLVAILSTLLRASLVVIVEEVISQLKWVWYRRPHSLHQLASFDEAARGPLGSLMLMFQIKKLNLALLGCIVIAFSLAIGPFTQQAIKALPCNQPFTTSSSSVTLPIANYMSSAIDVETKGAIVDGLVNPSKNHSVVASCPSGNCTFPSWSGITHSSVGMCSRCTDTTHKLTEVLTPVQYQVYVYGNASDHSEGHYINKTGLASTLVLPHGLSLGPVGPVRLDTNTGSVPPAVLNTSFGQLDWALPVSDPAFASGLQASVFNFTIIQVTDVGCAINMTHAMIPGKWGLSADIPSVWSYTCPHSGDKLNSAWDPYNIAATSCTLYPCVKDYHAQVENTVLNETVLQETPALVDMHYFNNWGQEWPNRTMLHFPCTVDGQVYTRANFSKIPSRNDSMVPMTVDNKASQVPQECFYQVDGAYLGTLQSFLTQNLQGTCSGNDQFADTEPKNRDSFTSCIHSVGGTEIDKWWLQSLYSGGNSTFGTVDSAITSMAISLTSRMRMAGKDGSNKDTVFVHGTAFQTRICTKVEWSWLLVPVVLLILTGTLLAIIVGKTYMDGPDVPIWKSSILPLLFAAPGSKLEASSGSLRDIRAEAVGNTVRLVSNERNGWEFEREDATRGMALGSEVSSLALISRSSIEEKKDGYGLPQIQPLSRIDMNP